MPVRFQVDPDFYDHPKTAGMSDAAFSLWVRAGSFSAAKLTDGFIAETVLVHTLRSDTPVADELVERGLWRRRRGGYVFHEWNQRNLTRQRVRDNQHADAARKREERKKSPKEAELNGDSIKPDSKINVTEDQVNANDVRPDSHRTPAGHHPESCPCCVGVGVVSSSSGYVEDKSADRARNDQRDTTSAVPRGPAPSGPHAVLAQRAVAAAGIGGKFGQSTVNRLAHEAAKLLDGGVEGTDVSAGLIRWKGSPGKGAGLLAELVNDVIREREFPPTRHLRAVNAVPVSNAPCGDYWQD